MATTMDAISLVKIHFGTKTRQNRHLKKALGMAYYPLLGMYTGYYVLDLINQYDRICLHTLLEQSVKNSARRQAAKQGRGKIVYNLYQLYHNEGISICHRRYIPTWKLVKLSKCSSRWQAHDIFAI